MPSKTGYWNQEEADIELDFSPNLAEFISNYFDSDDPVTDLGCGKAQYLRHLYDKGFRKLLGIEGSDLNNFEYGNVLVHDLTTLLDVSDKGNVICLEVGEHIPSEYSDIVVENICNNTERGKIAFVSWAVPNQPGYHHVNCRSNAWVIENFVRKGFQLLDSDTKDARSVIEDAAWYFRNTILIFRKD
jgi:hypothetical protein